MKVRVRALCSAVLCLGFLTGCTAVRSTSTTVPGAPATPAAPVPQPTTGTYYVDPVAGNDKAAGTSAAAPWQTLARVNSTSFKPGDKVLLHAGSVWHEQLTIPNNGTAQAPITFSSYGGGKPPILDGADEVTGWNLVTGSTYSAVFHPVALKGFVDATYEETTALNRAPSLAAVESTPGTVFSDGDYVYIHLPDGSSPDHHTVEISGARFYNILATNRSYISISGLELVRAARSGFLGNSTIDNSGGDPANSHITLTNVTVFNWGNAVSDFGPEDGGLGGIYVYGLAYHTQKPQTGWIVSSSHCGAGDVQPVLTYHVGCIDLEATGGATITSNTVVAVNAFGITVASFYSGDPCSAPTITGNDISHSEGNIRIAGCPNAVVSNNTIHDSSGYGIGIGSNGDTKWPINSTAAQLLGNTIRNLGTSADGTLYNGVDCSNGASGGVAASNTIAGVSGSSFTLEAGTWYPSGPEFPCTGWTLKNNTFDASANISTNPAAPLRVGPVYIRGLSIPGLTLQNNLYRLSSRYPNGMMYGFIDDADYSKDLTLSEFEAVAPNGGGAAPGSH